MLAVDDFNQLFASFLHTAFRLETLQIYRVGGLDERFEAFLAGEPMAPRTPETSPWLRQVADNAAAGRRTYRVHVVDRPLSDYVRYELDSYKANVACGEDVYIADRNAHPDLAPLHEDFWLLDDRDLILMRYDEEGHWLGAERAADEDLDEYRRRRDVALDHALPLREFLDSVDA